MEEEVVVGFGESRGVVRVLACLVWGGGGASGSRYEPLESSLETSSWGRCKGGERVFTDLSSPHGEAPSVSRLRLASCGDVPELIVPGGDWVVE